MPRRPPSHSFRPPPKASALAQSGDIHPPKASALGHKGVIPSPKASARALSASLANFQYLYNVWLQSLSKNTQRAYARDLTAFTMWKGIDGPEALTKILSKMPAAQGNMLALEWQNELVHRKLSPATINRMGAALSSFVKLLRMNGWVNWTIEIPKRRAKAYKDTKGCGADVIQRVIQGLSEQDTPKATRDEAILRLLWGLGLRRGELAHLQLEDLNFKLRKVMILGKGRHEQEALDLTEKMIDALRRWLNHRGKTPGALFWNFSRGGDARGLSEQGVWRITRAHGLGRAHGVRHASITAALENTNGDVRSVRRFSRHKDFNTLMIYDDNRKDSAKKISEALEGGI